MYILIAITSYFINAGVYVADKFLLSKKIHSSITYAFYVGIWSVFNIFLLVFGPCIPNLQELLLDLFAGMLFLVTLIFWYKALHQSEATRVVPLVGALVPIFSFIFSFIFLGASLGEREFLAFTILIMGGILISVKRTPFYALRDIAERFRKIFGDIFGLIHARYHPTQRLILNSVISALFFAVYYVLIKYIYSEQPFIGAFVWSRMGSFIGVLLIFLVPDWRKAIIKHQKGQKSPKNMGFFLGVRAAAALAFIMLNWAISLGNVALINSIQGVQYVFLMLLVVFISAKYPKIIEEELGGGVMLQKMMGVLMISIGLYMLIT